MLPRLVRVSRPAAAVVVLAQALLGIGVLWAFVAVSLELAYVGNRAFRFLALLPTLVLLWAAFRAATAIAPAAPRWPVEVKGLPLSTRWESRLFEEIADVARAVGAPVPERVIASFDPRFFLVSTRVITYDADREDRVLHLPLATMRVLTRDEFRAAVGHELAHFAPDEVAYTERIVPLRIDGSRFPRVRRFAQDPLSAPAAALLRVVLGPVDAVVAQMNLDRELAADRCAAAASSGRALASAIAKLAWTGPAVTAAIQAFLLDAARADAARAEAVRLARLASRASAGDAAGVRDAAEADDAAETGGSTETAGGAGIAPIVTRFAAAVVGLPDTADRPDAEVGHPLDHLPVNGDRRKALGVDAGDPLVRDLDPTAPAWDLFNDPAGLAEEIERRLLSRG